MFSMPVNGFSLRTWIVRAIRAPTTSISIQYKTWSCITRIAAFTRWLRVRPTYCQSNRHPLFTAPFYVLLKTTVLCKYLPRCSRKGNSSPSELLAILSISWPTLEIRLTHLRALQNTWKYLKELQQVLKPSREISHALHLLREVDIYTSFALLLTPCSTTQNPSDYCTWDWYFVPLAGVSQSSLLRSQFSIDGPGISPGWNRPMSWLTKSFSDRCTYVVTSRYRCVFR